MTRKVYSHLKMIVLITLNVSIRGIECIQHSYEKVVCAEHLTIHHRGSQNCYDIVFASEVGQSRADLQCVY